VSATVKLGGTAATDFKTGTVKSVVQTEKKDETLEFDATGEKDIGETARGNVRFSTSSLGGLGTIPAGTKLTSSSGLVFITDSAVTLSYQGSSNSSGTTTVTAAASGDQYNGATGALSGSPSNVSANFTEATSGGTTKVAKVVSADDIERAQGQLIGKSTDAEKKVLTSKFTSTEKVIDSSFTVERAAAVSAPAVNAEAASGKAKLTISTTYTIYGFAKADLETYLKSSLQQQITDTNAQKIYDTGADKVGLSNFRKEGDVLSVAITTTGQIGPKIDEGAIKEQVKGKIYGEVQSALQSIDGVKDVDVKFSFFWVRTVPNNTNKIHIEFKLENN